MTQSRPKIHPTGTSLPSMGCTVMLKSGIENIFPSAYWKLRRTKLQVYRVGTRERIAEFPRDEIAGVIAT